MVEWFHGKKMITTISIISFRTDTSAICFEKFEDIEKFLEFDEQLQNSEEKFGQLVSVI